MVPRAHKLLHNTPWILLKFTLLILVSSNSDPSSRYTDFVYKKCGNETQIPQILVSSLLQELVDKSTDSKFYHTYTGDDTFAVSGKFQCMHDLTIEDCHDCIVNIVTITRRTCSTGSLARVQLQGCFMSIELEREPELDNGRIEDKDLVDVRIAYLQHKKCGERKSWFEGLREVRDDVFDIITKCVTSSGKGYCNTRRDGIYAMGQCVASLEACECGECISNAFQVAQDECWGSDSGEVYLENCFVSFSDYQPHVTEGNSFRGNGVGGAGSGKVVAMVVGVGVALGLLSALCYCIRSSTRKQV